MTTQDFKNAHWQKSSRTNGGTDGAGACVEVAQVNEAIGVRDTKLRNSSPILVFDKIEWISFIAAIKHGDANLS